MPGPGACGIQLQLSRQLFGVALEDAKGILECDESAIAPDLADGAENADRAELFEDVRVAQESACEGSRFARWKVSSDRFDYGGDFFRRKAKSLKQARRFFERISDVIPFCQRGGVFWTMADEDTDIMQPGRSVKDVIVERLVLRELLREFIKAQLMAEFVGRIGLGANIIGNCLAVVDFWHTRRIANR